MGAKSEAEQRVEVLRNGFSTARTEAVRASQKAAEVRGPGSLAAMMAECKAWELAGRASTRVQEAFEKLGEALDQEPRP